MKLAVENGNVDEYYLVFTDNLPEKYEIFFNDRNIDVIDEVK